MSIDRHFLGWDGACLEKAAHYFIEKYINSAGFVDMQNVLIFLPGSRAGRRLLTLLTLLAEKRQVALIPPRITTVGSFISIFYQNDLEEASKIASLLAWVQALTSSDSEELKTIIPYPPKAERILDWLVLAETQRKIYAELSASKLSYQDVITKLEDYEGYNDDARWNVLAKICAKYKEILTKQGLTDRSILQEQYADLKLVPELPYQEVYLVATADINNVLKALIQELPLKVTALIHAPESVVAGFDELGCLKSEYWEKAQIEIKDEHIIITNKPNDQAEIIAKLLKDVPETEATVGIINPEIEPYLLRSLESSNIKARSALGVSMEVARPLTLLKACKAYIKERTFENLANLVRQIDIQSYLEKKLALPEQAIIHSLDEYQTEHLQDFVYGKLPDSTANSYNTVISVKDSLDELLKPFMVEKASFLEWREKICTLLLTVYAFEATDGNVDLELDPNKQGDALVIHTCRQLRRCLEECGEIPVDLLNEISGTEALELITHLLASEIIPLDGSNDGVEVLGWLEVHLDDAPFLVLSGFNEGFIPESLNADSYLPNSLRQILGLTDNGRRYARDAYEFSAVLASRDVYVVVGRSTARDELCMASRLLFATDKMTMAKRAKRFYSGEVALLENEESDDEIDSVYLDRAWLASQPEELKPFLSGKELQLKDNFSASALNTYLNCPYRYFLDKILHLEKVTDDRGELDALDVGSLLHIVLKNFSLSKASSSTKSQEIEEQLLTELRTYCASVYGKNALAAVKLQEELLIPRLKAFAKLQAKETLEGWSILPKFCEKQLDTFLVLQLDEEGKCQDLKVYFNDADLPPSSDRLVKVKFTAKIDRLDYNSKLRSWRLIDYKTSDSVKAPEKKFVSGAWTDLQLPLYKKIVQTLLECLNKGVIRLDVAYLHLPQDVEKVAISYLSDPIKKVSLDEAMQIAMQQAGDAILAILAQKFWPPQITKYTDDYSSLIGI